MINGNIILDLPGNELVQQFMKDEYVRSIKIYKPFSEQQLKLEVISEKGIRTISDLYGSEWECVSFPDFMKSHYVIIKRLDDDGYALSMQAKGLLGGGNGSSRKRKVEEKAIIATDRHSALQIAIEYKDLKLVSEYILQGADPNQFKQCKINDSIRRERIFFYAINSGCSAEILNVMVPSFKHHKNLWGEPAILLLARKFPDESYLSTIQLLLDHGAVPDETYEGARNVQHNVYRNTLFALNIGAARLLAASPKFNPNISYGPRMTLFLDTLVAAEKCTTQQMKQLKDLVLMILDEDYPIKLDLQGYLESYLPAAAKAGWLEVVKWLLQRVSPEYAKKIIDRDRYLQSAIRSNKGEIASLLIEYSTGVNTYGGTPFYSSPIEQGSSNQGAFVESADPTYPQQPSWYQTPVGDATTPSYELQQVNDSATSSAPYFVASPSRNHELY